MYIWLEFVLLSFVCYRVAQLFVFDEGPFGIFHRIRLIAGAYDLGINGQATTSFGRMMNCTYCVGMWVAVPLAIIATTTDSYNWLLALIYWLAISGLQSFLQGLTGGR